jgi:hypothetical protein
MEVSGELHAPGCFTPSTLWTGSQEGARANLQKRKKFLPSSSLLHQLSYPDSHSIMLKFQIGSQLGTSIGLGKVLE